jgi:hypothetical protein
MLIFKRLLLSLGFFACLFEAVQVKLEPYTLITLRPIY